MLLLLLCYYCYYDDVKGFNSPLLLNDILQHKQQNTAQGLVTFDPSTVVLLKKAVEANISYPICTMSAHRKQPLIQLYWLNRCLPFPVVNRGA